MSLQAFSDEYLPRTIIDRENEQDAIASYLKDIMLMKTSKVFYIHGSPGVGKSTVVRAVLSQFDFRCND